MSTRPLGHKILIFYAQNHKMKSTLVLWVSCSFVEDLWTGPHVKISHPDDQSREKSTRGESPSFESPDLGRERDDQDSKEQETLLATNYQLSEAACPRFLSVTPRQGAQRTKVDDK